MNADDDIEGAAAWEAIADGWAERVRTETDWNRKHTLDPAHLAMIGDVTGLRVLDAGCGEGRFARMLAELGARVTGMDFSHRMIELAAEKEQDQGLGIEYFQADMADLSALEDESFDLVVAYLSLIDVVRYEAAVVEIARVLKTGCRFVCSLVHPCFVTPGSEWVPREPGSIPLRDGDRLYRKVDNYFPEDLVRFRMWPTAPAETINYHRPLSDYAHACRDAGLFIRDIVEPTPDPELAEQNRLLQGRVPRTHFHHLRVRQGIRMTGPYRAVVFDLDGVLWDGEPLYHEAFNVVLEPVRIPAHDGRVRQHHRHLGRGGVGVGAQALRHRGVANAVLRPLRRRSAGDAEAAGRAASRCARATR